MLKTIALFLLCGLPCCTLLAQTASEKQVAARMETLKKMLVAPDSLTLVDLADDALSYGHSTGLIEDKTAFVADLLAGKTQLLNDDFTEQTIKVVGNTAIVRHRLTGENQPNGVRAKVDIIVLLVWKKEKNVWRLLARQGVKIPPAAPAK